MKGFLGVTSIIIIAMVLMFFGGAIYDITAAAGYCGLAVTDPNSNYDCGTLWDTVGRTFVFPDRNIYEGTATLQKLRDMEPSQLDELGIVAQATANDAEFQIIRGLAGFFILFGFLAFVFIKAGPSSSIDAGSKFIAILAALLVMLAMSAIFDDTPEHGEFAIFGERTPFKGIRLLLSDPEVMADIIDDSSVLPGTMNTTHLETGNYTI
jgi:hypothetical protein